MDVIMTKDQGPFDEGLGTTGLGNRVVLLVMRSHSMIP